MLALMYGGELCYWHHQVFTMQTTLRSSDALGATTDTSGACNQAKDFSPRLVMDATCGSAFADAWRQRFDARTVGVKFLRKYVDIVRNSVQGLGWDCRRAEELLLQMK